MPIYEYECLKCGKVHEISQKFADAPLGKCPDCRGKVQKLISRSSFALKGSGFYTTDYKRAGAKASEAKPAESAPSCGATPSSETVARASSPRSGGCAKPECKA